LAWRAWHSSCRFSRWPDRRWGRLRSGLGNIRKSTSNMPFFLKKTAQKVFVLPCPITFCH
jgi:hypothetical protein